MNPEHRTKYLSDLTRLISIARAGDKSAASHLLGTLLEWVAPDDSGWGIQQKRLLKMTQAHYGLADVSVSICSPQDRLPAEIVPNPKTEGRLLLSQVDSQALMPGTAIVAGCMNRAENLLKVIGSWLATTADEIVVVDWSSKEDLGPILSDVTDPRLKIVRINDEPHWIAAHALNVGFRFARRERIYRIDCDIEVAPDFMEINVIRPGEFIRGFWKSGLEHGGEGQQFIQGTFGAFKHDLATANYYDERILTYGWEDSELYLRLMHDHGLAARQIDPASLRHIEQSQLQRTVNQGVSRTRLLDLFEATEFEGAKNKYYTGVMGSWGCWSLSQDYAISCADERHVRGMRSTRRQPLNKEAMDLAEVLATNQLLGWAAGRDPELLAVITSIEKVGIDIDFARLVRDAHRYGRSGDLARNMATGENLYFFSSDSDACGDAVQKTIAVLCAHYPEFAAGLVISDQALDGAQNTLVAPRGAVIQLAALGRARSIPDFCVLEALLDAGTKHSCSFHVSASSITAESVRRLERLSSQLSSFMEPPPSPLPDSCLVSSLYDELNLIRMPEYVACLIANLAVFERIVIYYETQNHLFASIVTEIAKTHSVAPGRLTLVPFQKRPTFEELFATQCWLPQGTTIAVANADIFFNHSLAKLAQIDLRRNFVVLSRHDISECGQATPIRLDHGVPNTFSADAWIALVPFEPDFRLDYQIGTMHCDSFINNQVSKSVRYQAINPCLEIEVLHLHDDRFNSSAEKQVRDADSIRDLYREEMDRNAGENPVKGIAWGTIDTAKIIPASIQIQRWTPKVLAFRFDRCRNIGIGHLMLLHLLGSKTESVSEFVIMIKLRREDLFGPVGRLIAVYQRHFSLGNFLLDVGDEDENESLFAKGTMVRTTEFETVAAWAIEGWLDEKAWGVFAWPSKQGAKFLRCEFLGNLSDHTTLEFFKWLRKRDPKLIDRLRDLFSSLPDYSAEKNLITPFLVPQVVSPLADRNPDSNPVIGPAVSFITSLFRGSAFLPGYLENVYLAAKECGGEVIMVDVNQDDIDATVIEKFFASCPDARSYIEHIRLDHDPGLYECWRIAIERARAELVTNANIDDRRSPDHTLRLVKLLDQHPEYAGACGSMSCTKTDGTESWFSLSESEIWFYFDGIREIGFEDLFLLDANGNARSRDVMHCMPVWRKSLHLRHGFFDEERYGTSADWAFWLKCTKEGERFGFDKNAFGRYFQNPDSHNRRNDPYGLKEKRIIRDLIGIDQTEFSKQ